MCVKKKIAQTLFKNVIYKMFRNNVFNIYV